MTKQEIDSYINELRIKAWQNYVPVMREKTASLLADYIQKYLPTNILEIGTSIGTSGLICLNNAKGKLTTIEIDEDTQEEAKVNIKHCGFYDRVEFVLGDCNQVVFMMDGNHYDFIVLDGPKSHYLELYKMIITKLLTKGIIFVDNVSYHDLTSAEGEAKRKHRTIVKAMREFLQYIDNDKSVTVTKYDIEDGVIAIQKH